MKEFMERWNTEPKFKTKIQLGLYTLFVVAVFVFAISTRSEYPIDPPNLENKENNQINESKIDNTIEIPKEYKYTINVTINEEIYQYIGHKKEDEESINKIINDETIEYLYQNDNYYIKENETYILTTKKEVYSEIEQNYLNLETINQYLSKATKSEEQYLVYLKDIILGNDSEEYIVITKEENKININYTSLIKLFDQTINQCLVEVIIEEIE